AKQMNVPIQKNKSVKFVESPKNYFHSEESIPFSDEKLWAYYFTNLPFTPAPPPMQARYDGSQEATLSPDKVFNLKDSKQLSELGLYFIQSDTTTSQGNGFLVVHDDYPKFRKVEDLVRPLLYISTQEETQQILAATDKKAALDTYWLKQADGRVAAAKTMIRTFYNRVTYANHFFASYKAGWQSDRGMIHIVFGEPEQKIVTLNGESWFYTRIADGETYNFTFDFDRIYTPLSDNHYVLKRTRDHKINWYRGVSAWRSYEGWF
ncbi:MAG: GWxTD domain-containing protein, partial [Bacteroidota bacterium]